MEISPALHKLLTDSFWFMKWAPICISLVYFKVDREENSVGNPSLHQQSGDRPPGSVCPTETFLALLLSPAYFCSTPWPSVWLFCPLLCSTSILLPPSLSLQIPFVLAQPGLAGLRWRMHGHSHTMVAWKKARVRNLLVVRSQKAYVRLHLQKECPAINDQLRRQKSPNVPYRIRQHSKGVIRKWQTWEKYASFLPVAYIYRQDTP